MTAVRSASGKKVKKWVWRDSLARERFAARVAQDDKRLRLVK
jgi:hypothetical protein